MPLALPHYLTWMLEARVRDNPPSTAFYSLGTSPSWPMAWLVEHSGPANENTCTIDAYWHVEFSPLGEP